MKSFITLLVIGLFAFTSLSAQAQDPITAFFEQYRNDENFTQVNISPKMFEMFANMDAETTMDADTKEMLKSLKGLKILTTEMTPRKFYKEFTSKVSLSVYEELMTVRDGDSDITFLIKDSDGGNIVNELLLLVGGEDDFVLMSFAGKIPLDKVGKLASGLNISGAEHLDKLKK